MRFFADLADAPDKPKHGLDIVAYRNTRIVAPGPLQCCSGCNCGIGIQSDLANSRETERIY